MENQIQRRLLALLRITLSVIFLWAFFDKLLGLGFATSADKSWLAGVSPTQGFLTNGTGGPFGQLFQSMGGSVIVDYLFMLGLLGVGSALLLGIGMKIATISGVTLMMLIYLAGFPPANNPIIDEHIIYILSLLLLYSARAGEYFGLGKRWQELPIVKRFSMLS